MDKHSILPPSSASRRVACPGSREMEARYPENKESEHAREGEAAHWVARMYLEKGGTCEFDLTAPNGEIITNEMQEGAKLYCSDIWNIKRKPISEQGHVTPVLFIEEKIKIPSIHPDCWGTPDAWLFTPDHLYLWDYKYGHAEVEVFENWQLIEYAAGILHELGINGQADQHTRVTMRIVQPRCYTANSKIREWSLMASELRPYFNILEARERAAMEPTAQCITSKECNYCSAAHACSSLQQVALTAIDISKQMAPWDLPAAEVGPELARINIAIERLKARKNGLEGQAEAMIKRGERVPYFTLEAGRSTQQWSQDVSVEDIKLLGELMGVSVLKPEMLITPKQAIDAGLPKKEVIKRSQVMPGAMRLVQEKPKDTRKAFGGK